MLLPATAMPGAFTRKRRLDNGHSIGIVPNKREIAPWTAGIDVERTPRIAALDASIGRFTPVNMADWECVLRVDFGPIAAGSIKSASGRYRRLAGSHDDKPREF